MNRTFTVGEAQTLLPVLESLLVRARQQGLRANTLNHEMQQLSHRIHLAGGMHVDVVGAARRRGERDKAAQQVKDTLAEIEEIGVTVQDFGEGILDFPCQIDGEIVLLCWKLGESVITHWHTTEEDADARRPLDVRFGKGESERLN